MDSRSATWEVKEPLAVYSTSLTTLYAAALWRNWLIVDTADSLPVHFDRSSNPTCASTLSNCVLP